MVRMKRVPSLVPVVTLVVAMTTGALGQDASPGITATTVRLGITGPLTGPVAALSAVSEGIRVRVDAANAAGGVRMGDGKQRKVELIVEDDGLNPQRTLSNVRKMVERDGVLAIVGTVATPNNQAIGRYTNQAGIPNIMMYSGVHELNGPDWEMGFLPSFPTEARTFADHIRETKPNAKLAVLYLNTETGHIFNKALDKALMGSGIQVVGRQPVTNADPTVETQLSTLKASGADTLVVVTAPRHAAEAIRFTTESGWKPMTLVSNIASSLAVLRSAGLDNAKGVITATFLKQVASLDKSGDAGSDKYLTDHVASKASFKVDDTVGQTGYVIGDALIMALEKMKAPTRQALMDSVRNMEAWPSSMLLPGITMTTKAGSDVLPVESLGLFQFDGKAYQPLGGLRGFEGKAGSF